MTWAPPAEDVDAGPGAGWTPPAEDKDSDTSFLGNTWEDVKGNVKGVGQLAKAAVAPVVELAKGNPREALNKFGEVVSSVPAGIIQEGKRIGAGELLTGHPINAAKKFGGAVYDKPVSTALDVAALFGLGKGAAGALGKAGEVGELGEAATKAAMPIEEAGEAATKVAPAVEEATRVAQPAGEPVNLPPEAQDVLKKVATNLPPTGEPSEGTPPPAAAAEPFAQTAERTAQDALGKAQEVKNYISRGYEGFAKKPGGVAQVADYVQGKSQMAANQQMGFTPGQLRKLGETPAAAHEAARAIGQYGIDSGIVDVTNGVPGMIQKNASLLKETGGALKQFREAADKANVYQPDELLSAVRQRLDQKYLRGVTAENPTPRGVHGSESAGYKKALQDLEDAPATHVGAAEVATKLNKDATAANQINQPHNAFTDVANAISDINNERINQILGPEKAAKYEQALREFGVNKKISAALKFKSAGEVKRLGPGSMTSNLVQKALDEVGYKVGAKAANRLSTSILKNPGVAKNLPSLFKEFINHVEDTMQDVTGMSEGGVVTPEMAAFAQARR